MANLNFVNSQAAKIQLKLEDWLTGDSGARLTNYRNKSYETIRRVGLNNNVKMLPLWRAGDAGCTAVEVVFLKDCTALGAFTCATPITTCDLPAGTEMGSQKLVTDVLCEFRESFQINDDLCGNLYQVEDILRIELTKAIQNLRIKADKNLIAGLSANAQVNIDPDTIGTIAGTKTNIASSFWQMDLLPQLNQILMFNGIENYLIADNRNFSYAQSLSPYLRLNDNQRSVGAIDDDYQNVFDDSINIQATLGTKSTFAIDTDMVGVVHWNKYDNTAPLMIKDNHWVYSIIDPEWSIRSATYDPQSGRGSASSVQRVVYDVELQKICTGRTATGKPIFMWKYMVTLQIKPVFSPVQCDNTTGIMEFVKVP